MAGKMYRAVAAIYEANIAMRKLYEEEIDRGYHTAQQLSCAVVNAALAGAKVAKEEE